MAAADNLLKLLDRKIAEFEGKPLLETEKKCFSRCLSFQAGMARRLAYEKGWIAKDEVDLTEMFSDLDERKKKTILAWLKDIKDIPSKG